MPFFAFTLESLAGASPGGIGPKFEDDRTAEELGDAIDKARGEAKRLVTFTTITADDLAAAASEGTPSSELPALGEKDVTGSWDPKDVIHVWPLELVEQFDLEGEEAPPPTKREEAEERKAAAQISQIRPKKK